MSLQNQHLYEFNGFKLDTSEKQLWRGDEAIPMPLKAIETLCLLVENNGKLLTKDVLMNELWADTFVEDRNLSQNIFTLRKKLGEKKNGIKFIETVPKRGYRFVAEVNPIYEEEVIELTLEEKTTMRADIDQDSAQFVEDVLNKQNLVNTEAVNNHPTARLILDEKDSQSRRLRIITQALLAVGVLILFAGAFSYWFGLTDKFFGNKPPRFSGQIANFDKLTVSGNAYYPNVSRDNENLIFVRSVGGKNSIILQNIRTKSETVVVAPQEHELRSLTFSADGNYVFYAIRDPKQPDSTVYKIPIFGGSKEKLITGIRHVFSLSSSGSQFAFYRYSPETDEILLVISNLDGTEEKIITGKKRSEGFAEWGRAPSWSPDDKKLVVTTHSPSPQNNNKQAKSDFVIIDIETAQEEVVKTPDWELNYEAFWLRDGSGFFVAVQEKRSEPRQIWHLEYPNGKATRITNDTNFYERFRPTYDSSGLILMKFENPTNLFLIDIDNPNELKTLTNEVAATNGRLGLIWSQDGKELFYIRSKSYAEGNVWKLNVQDGKPQQLTFDESKFSRKLTMMPDGQSLLFGSNRSGDWNIWQMDTDGENLSKFITESDIGYPEVSSDGNWLFYVSPASVPKSLFKTPINGDKKGEEILKNAGGFSKSSPTNPDQVISHYFLPKAKDSAAWRHVLISHSEKNIIQDLSFANTFQNFDWSADGKGIYYGTHKSPENEIEYLSLETKETRKLFEKSNLGVINLAVSPDGKSLAFAGQSVKSDILQITFD